MAGLLDQFYGPRGRNPTDKITNLLNYEATIANRGTGPLSGWYKTHVVPDIEGDDISEYESAASFGVPKDLYDFFSNMAKGGAALQGQLPADPALMTDAAMSSSMGGSVASLAGGPEGAALGANRLGRFSDWKWKPAKKVREELGLTEVPGHVQKFGNFMQRQADKAKAGKMTPRDLIKAFTITRSSIQRGAVPAAKVRAAGLNIPGDGKVRPEGAFSEWLLTPMGQRYLNSAEKGVVDQDAVADAVKVMAPFGRHTKDIPDALTAAATGLNPSTATKILADGDTKAWRKYAKGLKGIGPAKQGFVASLLGKGDIPTLDARQLRLHTGKSPKEAQANLARKGWGDKAVDRLTRRQQDMALAMPTGLEPHRQHLTHHTVWDAVGGDKTTHADVVRAMELGANKGLLAAAPQLARTAASTRTQDPTTKRLERIANELVDTQRALATPNPRSGKITVPYTARKVTPAYAADLDAARVFRDPKRGYAPEKTISIEDLQGGAVMKLVGDRSNVGLLDAFRGVRLPEPMVADGGRGYMRGLHQGAWASDDSVVTKLAAEGARAAGKEGRPVYGAYSPMGGTSSDFATMSVSSALGNFNPKVISKADAASFDGAFRKLKGAPKDYPGIKSPKLDGWLAAKGTNRYAFMKHLDKDEWVTKKGFPDAAAARHAITDPKLLHLPEGKDMPGSEAFSGQSFALLDPSFTRRPVTDLKTPHTTYPTDLPGTYVGGLDVPAPRSVLFRDWYDKRRAAGIPTSGDGKSFEYQSISQPVDQQMVDEVMQFQGILRALRGDP